MTYGGNMKNTKKLTTWLMTIAFGFVMLTGCATHTTEVLQQNKETELANKAMVAQYFTAQNSIQTATANAMANKGETTALVLYGQLVGQQNAAVIKAFKMEPMALPTNGYDVWNTFMDKTVPTAVRWGFGFLLGKELIEGLAAASTVNNVAGDYIPTTQNLSAGGDLNNNLTLDNSTFNATLGDDGLLTLDSYNTPKE